MRVQLFNMIAALLWKLGLPTQLCLWLAHPKTFRRVRVHRGAIILAKAIEVEGSARVLGGTKIFCERLSLGRGVEIRKKVSIVTKDVILGDGVQIDDGVQAEGGFRSEAHLTIDEGVWVFQNTILNTTCGLSIGAWSGIGGYCMIWSHGSWQSELDGYPTKYAATRIGRNVWLPWHVIVMPGVGIGDNVTLAAGSTVVKDVPANSLAAGTPAKALKSGIDQWPARTVETIQDYFDRKLAEFQADPAYQNDWRIVLSGKVNQSRPTLRVVWDEAGENIRSADPKTLYICRNADIEHLAGLKISFLDIGHRRFSVPDGDATVRAYLRFLTNFGIRGLELSSGCPSHRC